MDSTLVDNNFEPVTRQPSVAGALSVITSPRALYARVEDTGAYGWTLVTLLALVMTMGYLQVQSGLIDQLIANGVEQQKAALEADTGNLLDRSELRERMADIEKGGEFLKTVTRLGVIVLEPLRLLGSYLLIAAVAYALVALSGRKPEWHTLMGICVYAGVIDLIAYGIRLGMVFYYRTLEMDTSLRALTPPDEPSFLAGVDPFRIWFWFLVAVGLTVTRQLSRRMAIASCAVMGVIAMALPVAMEFAAKGQG